MIVRLRKKAVVLFAVMVLLGLTPIISVDVAFNTQKAQAAGSTSFTDVPADSWAAGAIDSAVANGLMSGMGENTFGFGKTITRADFVTVLCNLFDWPAASPTKASFTDVLPEQWFYGYVETAAAQGIVEEQGSFRSNEPILRKDMASMLVKALGYAGMAEQMAARDTTPLPFVDVDEQAAYIRVAYDLGIISGTGNGKFAPDSTSKREEAAAMLIRVYDKMNRKTNWRHGFYAFSSYNQRERILAMNAVTFSWSAMEWSLENGAVLNTTTQGGNTWRIPDSYELIADYPRQNGKKTHLGVYMDVSMGLSALLGDEKARQSAATQIVTEATRTYDALGYSPYDGVTIDFEGLTGETAKGQYTQFLTGLAKQLKQNDRALYVAVHTVTLDGQYFDGYDYKAIGQLADKVILMAHDYQPASLTDFVGTKWQNNAALTPAAEVYKALKAITDPAAGVTDRNKIALAVSYAAVGWEIDENDRVKTGLPVTPSTETLQMRMNQPDTVLGWSEVYLNPYMIYTTENGERVFLWYENSRSIAEKEKLAGFFDVTGVSVWRIGIIPNA